jgi:membrane protease YdiL (CAAX protease family)
VNVFFNDRRQLRAGWRIAVFIALFIAGSIVLGQVALLVGLAGGGADEETTQFVARSLSFLVIAVATAIAARATEGRSFGDVGFGFHRGWWRHAAYGFAFGSALLAAAALPIALTGAADTSAGPLSGSIAAAFAFFGVAAALEELLCRGFVFQALVSGLNAGWATVLTAAAFAALHLSNPESSPIAMATTFFAGVFFAIAYLRTRSLWLATGAHHGWNFSMGMILGMPVSGLRFYDEAAALRTDVGGPAWFTGGAYGPEGGLVALLAIGVGCVLVAKIPLPAGGIRERA